MALPVNVGQIVTDGFWGAASALLTQAIVDYTNMPFLAEPAVIGTGMNNAELFLNLTGGLALAGGLFSLVSKKKLIGGADKNLIGFGGGVLLGTKAYPTLVAPLIGQVPSVV